MRTWRKRIAKEATIRALVYRPGHKPELSTVTNELSHLQRAVDGKIECFETGISGTVGICNEEFLFRDDLLPNRRIKAIQNWICGDFLIVGDAGPEFGSLSDEQVERARKLIS